MTKAKVSTTVDEETKLKALAVLKKLGISLSEAFNLFILDIASRKHIPIRGAVEDTSDDGQESILPELNTLDRQVEQFCSLLAKAESNKQPFISLKWFRDSYLTRYASKYKWIPNLVSRQKVLSETISRDLVSTGKVTNPNSPDFPTTTISLNREKFVIPGEVNINLTINNENNEGNK